jgi:methylmalonyl-CoA/ethylmalonyl-CoA epimerase
VQLPVNANNLQYLDMNKIEHIGIAVNNLQTAGDIYQKLLNTTVYKIEEVLSEGVKTAFLQNGPNKIELLEATNPDSPIAKFIAKKGEGIHHIAFDVDDIRAEMARLKAEGFVLLNEEPKRGADNKLVCFVHPKSANGVLVELCQEVNSLLWQYDVQFLKEVSNGHIRHIVKGGGVADLLSCNPDPEIILDGILNVDYYLNGGIDDYEKCTISTEIYTAWLNNKTANIYPSVGNTELLLQSIPLQDFKSILQLWLEFIKS